MLTKSIPVSCLFLPDHQLLFVMSVEETKQPETKTQGEPDPSSVLPDGYVKTINLTPHDINVYEPDGKTMFCVIPSKGIVRSGTVEQSSMGTLSPHWTLDSFRLVDTNADHPATIPLVSPQTPTGVTPESQELLDRYSGCNLIVSLYAAKVLKDWTHKILVPDTGPDSVVRNPEGQILGVRRFEVH